MNILVVGATSSIARETALELAKRGHQLFLVGREVSELERIAQDIKIRTDQEVGVALFDCLDVRPSLILFNDILKKMGNIDGVVWAAGYLGDQHKAEIQEKEAQRITDINYRMPALFLGCVANYLEQKKGGFILGMASIAGDRGRQKHYLYCAAKAAFATYLSGLRQRLHKSSVQVLSVKLGLVDTAMTFGRQNPLFMVDPKTVAKKMVMALEKGKDEVYLPRFVALYYDS